MRIGLLKVWRDLWNNKGRTILVVVSIAVGVLAVGVTTSTLTQVTEQMKAAHLASSPAAGHLHLSGFVDDDTIASLRNVDNVAETDGYAQINIHWKSSLEDSEWQEGRLIMVRDYADQKLDQMLLEDGDWPGIQAGAVNANHIEPFHAPGLGETVYLEINDRARALEIGGAVHDPFQYPPPFETKAAFYVDRQTFYQLTGVDGYNQIRFTLADYSEDNVRTAATDIEDRLKMQGIVVGFVQVLHPERAFFQDEIDGISFVLVTMALASLGLSTILVINTINALIAQQVPQIGIMKAVGAVRGQIFSLYLSGVTVYGILSLVVAVPLGALGSKILSEYLLHMINTPRAAYELLPETLLLQISTGLLTPLLAALYPILQGVLVAVANALRQRGLISNNYGNRILDKLLGRIRGLPRLGMLALRNTFRQPGRVFLTLLTLIVSGAVFVMVMSTHYSFNKTLEVVFEGFGYDVQVALEQPQVSAKIIPLIETRPNVERVEMWTFAQGKAELPGIHILERKHEIDVYGVPEDTQLFSPVLLEGRLLLPEDGRALLLNRKLAEEMNVGVGDQIEVNLGAPGDGVWTVVGLIFDLGGRDQNTIYMNLEPLSVALNQVGRANIVQIHASENTLAMQQVVEKDVKDYLEGRGLAVGSTDTAWENREHTNAQFSILTTVLLVMTVLMAVVGSIGLSGTLSINVLERTREIGVMRALGASSLAVSLIFIGEGLMLGIVSWMIGMPLGYAVAPAFVSTISDLIKLPILYFPSLDSMGIWLAVVVTLSVLASWAPARRATMISVNESLAYE